MYNESIKQEFLASQVKSVRYKFEYIFKLSEPFELQYKKDLYAFTYAEVFKFQQELFLRCSFITRSNSHRLLKRYARWAINNELTSNNFAAYCNPMISNNKTAWVSTPMVLKQRMDLIFDSVENKTTDIAKRCFLWAAFVGISKKRVMDIKDKDVVLGDENYVIVDEWRYYLPEEAARDFELCLKTDGYRVLHCTKNFYTEPYPKRESDFFFRTHRVAKPLFISYKSLVADKCEECNANFIMTYDWIQESGIFYRTYSNELLGITPDFYELLQERYPEGLSRSVERGSKLSYHIKVAEVDYNNWKSEFGLI